MPVPAQGAISQERLAHVARVPCEGAEPGFLVCMETFQSRGASCFANDWEANAVDYFLIPKPIQFNPVWITQAASSDMLF